MMRTLLTAALLATATAAPAADPAEGPVAELGAQAVWERSCQPDGSCVHQWRGAHRIAETVLPVALAVVTQRGGQPDHLVLLLPPGANAEAGFVLGFAAGEEGEVQRLPETLSRFRLECTDQGCGARLPLFVKLKDGSLLGTRMAEADFLFISYRRGGVQASILNRLDSLQGHMSGTRSGAQP